MKIFQIKSALLIILLNTIIFPQWSTDPNNNLIVGYGLDPNICSDSAGGCYITYDYDNLSYPRKLALERIDRYGYKPWGTKKQIMGELPGQWNAELIEDGEGGVIISFQDLFENIPQVIQKIRVQKVDSSGNFLWGTSGINVTLEDNNQGSQNLVSDGSGGCVIAWKTFSSVFYVNRISENGERLWSDSGLVLGESNFSGTKPRVIRASDGYYYVETGEYIYRLRDNGEIVRKDSVALGYTISDNEGGIVLSSRVWNGMIPKLVAQRKDSLGNNLWQEPYIEIADSLHINSVPMVSYSSGYYYYSWYGTKNGINKVTRFQALRQDGSKLFSDIGIQISNPPLNGTIIIPLAENRTGFVYYSSDFLPDSLLIQTYDTLGNKVWQISGVHLAHPPIESQSFTADKNGGFIIGGTKNEFTIVVQQVSRNGNLGEVLPVPVELLSFTGKANDKKIILNWITATELNNQGFEIERLKDQKIEGSNEWEKIGFVEGHGTTTETHTYSFIDNEILSGKIKYRLKQIDFDGTFEYSNEIEIDVDLTPKEFVLQQNYPNPFNPSTKIKFTIPAVETHRDASLLTTLQVYDILGNEVATLVNETKPAGTYEVEFNAEGITSGVYFYQLKAGHNISTKKLLLLK